ncbi:TPA: hypothetical protein ACH3X1_011127 [Trebouxia sp. C0004]
MQQTKGSTSRPPAIGYSCDKHARSFTYGWKRLARTSGMQQHTEHRSVRKCSKLSVMTRAVLERPPPASFVRQRSAIKRYSDAHRQRALLQESLLESAPSPSQTNTEAGGSSFQQALFNSVNIMLGVGMLSIPYALKEGGWATLGVLGLLWGCTNYTGKVLVKCQEVYCRKTSPVPLGISTTAGNKLVITQIAEEGLRDINVPYATAAVLPGPTSSAGEDIYREPVIVQTPSPCLLQSYEDVGQAAFGDAGRAFITAVLYTELIGTCALFFILEGDHLQLLCQQLLGGHKLPSHGTLMAVSAGLFLPTTWLPDLGALSYVGALGVVSALGLTGVVVYNFVEGGVHLAQTSPLHLHSLPVTFGLSAFVYSGHAVFPSIYRSMKDRSQYPRMLDTTYAIVGITGAFMGVAGYAMYGNKTLEEVTMNLHAGPLQLAATSLILVSPFTKFALTLEPVARGVEQLAQRGRRGQAAWKSSRLPARVTRTALGLGALLLATKVPYFGYVMAVIGSFLTITVSVIFPSLCYLKLYDSEIEKKEKLLNYFIVALGVFCALSGTWTSVQSLLQELSEQ